MNLSKTPALQSLNPQSRRQTVASMNSRQTHFHIGPAHWTFLEQTNSCSVPYPPRDDGMVGPPWESEFLRQL